MDSFAEGVQAFERVCYWATDRLGLTSRSAYELEWGNLILLLAWDGKLDLILRRCEDQGEVPPPASLQADLARLRESWATYVADFREDVVRDLEGQFERSIMTRLRTVVEAPAALSLVEELERFLEERDTIEVFLESAERQFPGHRFRRRIDDLDTQTRALILQHIGPGLVQQYGPAHLAALNAAWLPDSYWWRHVDWAVAGGDGS